MQRKPPEHIAALEADTRAAKVAELQAKANAAKTGKECDAYLKEIRLLLIGKGLS